MIPDTIRSRAVSISRSRDGGLPVGLMAAAGVGALLVVMAIWIVATMNVPPVTQDVTAEVPVHI
jgi:hypothetical protein